MVTLENLDNGNLKIVLDDKEELLDVIDRKQDERDGLFDILERSGHIGNGWAVIFNAGLTEAPVIGEQIDYEDSGEVTAENIYYFNNYMIQDYLAILRDEGSVEFTKHYK